MTPKLEHTAAPQVAGLLFQLERALYHLSRPGHGVSVAVEMVDDVSRHRSGKVIAQEQDKHSVRPQAEILGDRSQALWRTLQIWVQSYRLSKDFCECYYLVTNVDSLGGIVSSILAKQPGAQCARQIVQALRHAGSTPRRRRVVDPNKKSGAIQSIIDDVLLEPDDVLVELVARIEVVKGYNSEAARPEIADGFGLVPTVEQATALQALLGWFHDVLREAWQRQEPGIVSRDACLRQCRLIERNLLRSRLLPRPASQVPIAPNQVEHQKGRPFVDHLSRIAVSDDIVIESIEHFIQFNTEKHRLVREGEIDLSEWAHRGARLKQRWTNERRLIDLHHRDKSRIHRGQLVFAHTTYQHRESLAGMPCEELYMTSGHYHRLADDDEVWWDPEYVGS